MGTFRLLAIVIAVAVAALFGGAAEAIRDTDLRQAIGVVAAASATLLGFLVSAGALLYAVANTRLARNLQRTQHFNRLLADLFIDAAAFLVALLVALGSLFLPTTAFGSTRMAWLYASFYAIVFVNAAAYLLLLPVGYKLWLLLSSIGPDEDARAIE